MKLKTLSETPPTKWFYVQYETAHRFLEPDFEALKIALFKHRVSNNLPRPTMAEVDEDIQNQICSRVTSCHCKDADFEPAQLSARAIFDAMRALSERLEAAEIVSQEEATRRADICRRCAFNQPATGCFGMCASAFKALFQSTNRGHTTIHDANIMNCQACGCSCQVIIHFPLMTLRWSIPEERQKFLNRIPHCWRNENNLAPVNS